MRLWLALFGILKKVSFLRAHPSFHLEPFTLNGYY
ncbi:hypothetical protein PANA5342_pPANA10030 (plasmid) [Pantoea ananatis LMG 5342]|nr:hypothetical protein PANA5342_pPANA10030 [Pantoea ananatis LMG 5342]